MHYQRAKAAGTLSQSRRLLVNPDATMEERLQHHGWTTTQGGCWEFNGGRNRRGYGMMAVGHTRYVNGRKQSVSMLANRAAHIAWLGPIPDGLVVCHKCDNPPCINPQHLFLGTRTINNQDASRKQRTVNGEHAPHHKLSDDDVAEIRRRYSTGAVTQGALAAEFGVSRTLISFVVNRRRRRHPTYRRATPAA